MIVGVVGCWHTQEGKPNCQRFINDFMTDGNIVEHYSTSSQRHVMRDLPAAHHLIWILSFTSSSSSSSSTSSSSVVVILSLSAFVWVKVACKIAEFWWIIFVSDLLLMSDVDRYEFDARARHTHAQHTCGEGEGRVEEIETANLCLRTDSQNFILCLMFRMSSLWQCTHPTSPSTPIAMSLWHFNKDWHAIQSVGNKMDSDKWFNEVAQNTKWANVIANNGRYTDKWTVGVRIIKANQQFN